MKADRKDASRTLVWVVRGAVALLVGLGLCSFISGILAATVYRSVSGVTAAGAWFGGVATASAFTVAFWVYRTDRMNRDQEQRDRAEQEEQARRLEAELVRPTATFGGETGTRVTTADVTVANFTTAPVFDLVVRLGYGREQWPVGDLQQGKRSNAASTSLSASGKDRTEGCL